MAEDLRFKVSDEVLKASHFHSGRPETADLSAWKKFFQTIYQEFVDAEHIVALRKPRSQDQAIKPQQSSLATPAHETNPVQGVVPAQTTGDPMVLDRMNPTSREQCVKQRLCFYCKKPGHNKGNCEQKKINDARFGRNTNQLTQLPQGTAQTFYQQNHQNPAH